MTKAELQKDRDEWKQQAESLQDDLDSLNEAYSELEEINYKLSNNMDINSIYNDLYWSGPREKWWNSIY